jgi:hypothetical protein
MLQIWTGVLEGEGKVSGQVRVQAYECRGDTLALLRKHKEAKQVVGFA